MPLIRNSFTRKTCCRDARLIVIATEGTVTEPDYFDGLNEQSNPKIKINVIRKETTNSSPAHVLHELDKVKKSYSLRRTDQLWMVIDRDRWPQKNLKKVASACLQKGYELVVSNPCFELWLLLHFTDAADEDKRLISENKSDYIANRIKRHTKAYQKPRFKDIKEFLSRITTAIDNAEKLDVNKRLRWPNEIGTRVYRLVVEILPFLT